MVNHDSCEFFIGFSCGNMWDCVREYVALCMGICWMVHGNVWDFYGKDRVPIENSCDDSMGQLKFVQNTMAHFGRGGLVHSLSLATALRTEWV